ncbi:hypothetical protein C4K26_1282 [Pseudomonas chlororaphis]|nr:hypothetical protein C4K26_1282 [Pseudomonas chlororaphis]
MLAAYRLTTCLTHPPLLLPRSGLLIKGMTFKTTPSLQDSRECQCSMRPFTYSYRGSVDYKNSPGRNGAKHSAALVVFPCIKLVKCAGHR